MSFSNGCQQRTKRLCNDRTMQETNGKSFHLFCPNPAQFHLLVIFLLLTCLTDKRVITVSACRPRFLYIRKIEEVLLLPLLLDPCFVPGLILNLMVVQVYLFLISSINQSG
uniref:Uncharacterized protein n=1 Tax=Rhizophora mucronata TaxID=61149 RepID=A0A2P2PVM1_RHIMU